MSARRRRSRSKSRGRPLSDPRRAPYARAALDRRDRAKERAALEAVQADATRHTQAVLHVRECLALLEEEP